MSAGKPYKVPDGTTAIIADGDATMLLIDLDDEEDYQRYAKYRDQLCEMIGCIQVDKWRSRSGSGWHVQLELEDPAPLPVRIFYQALLGSDPKREYLAYFKHGDGPRSVLFKPTPTT